ncbi:hypothetical protein C8R44DRAFT_894074 [Mycena epipterygia]|nr:hypothetical protein C8R44DRAFT_894074 [Mycena epipterygia]
MPPNAAPAPKHTAADLEIIDSLSGRDLIEFRNYVRRCGPRITMIPVACSPAYIRTNAAVFFDNDWIDIADLSDFLLERNHASILHSIPAAPRVKVEAPDLHASTLAVKQESASQDGVLPNPVRTRTLHEGGVEVFEILSDSELGDGDAPGLDSDSDFEVAETLMRTASRLSNAPPTDPSDIDLSDLDDTDETCLQQSDTIWQDPGITSQVIVGTVRVTLKVTVERMEYISELPSIWPIHRTPTAVIMSLDSSYDMIDPSTGVLYTLDHLIQNHDNDSWQASGTGAADNTAQVIFGPGETAIECRRARKICRGGHACERVDPNLMQVERYDLDLASRDAVFAAQRETCRTEGTTPENTTAGFFDIISKKKCTAIDALGHLCGGKPKLMLKTKGTSRGYLHWIACNGWTKQFKENHRNYSIPDYVNEAMLIKLFDDEPIADDDSKDTALYCPSAHREKTQALPVIRHYPCKATRAIYVPTDPTIRKALVIHNIHKPHCHPMPALTKVSVDVKAKYRACIDAAGCVGATVNKVEHANSTAVLLSGKTPALFSPALQNQRVKREMIHTAKLQKYPSGLGIAGAFQLYLEDLKKPSGERYIHCCRTTTDGGILIITGVPFLIKLLDDPGVRAFKDDMTFKRVEGQMNEWELALYLKAVQRDFFEILFDELQRIKKLITGKILGLKCFVRGGNLLVMNADMEAAQVLGAARSIMKHNDPEYSGIPNDTPASEAATYFVKICYRHSKAAILDFKGMVTPAQYDRLMNFMYIDSKESLDEFSDFVKKLGVKKIQDWWMHKEMSDWMIPCLVNSQSRIFADNWDSMPATTNTGEAQHHWTNSITGIKARTLDENVAREIQSSMETGILANSQNEAYHRGSRNLQRQANTAEKVRRSNDLTNSSKEINAEIAELKAGQRQSTAREKALREQLKSEKAGSTSRGKTGSRSAIISASSSGRVKTAAVMTGMFLVVNQWQPCLTIVHRTRCPRRAPDEDTSAVSSSEPRSEDLAVTIDIDQPVDGSSLSLNMDAEWAALMVSSAPLDAAPGANFDFPAPYFPNYYAPVDLNPFGMTDTFVDPSASLALPEGPAFDAWGPVTIIELISFSGFYS